ncbi:MAG: hypothetical protein K0R10_2727 [Alphaproteobacteria bacterium]|jgi:hypothetical protein|nr:hypothetical protein [Alphaproteobacteria bacterium]
MLEKLFRRFRQDNGISPEAETSPYINIEGLEGKIKVPAATDEDKQWAKKTKNATSDAVAKALHTAIEQGNNWRVWYLLNRPVKSVRNMFGRVKQLGFDGGKALASGIEKAASVNNVTAAYLLLKYAELKKREEQAESADIIKSDPVRTEMKGQAVNGMINTASLPGGDVFALLVKTFSMNPQPQDTITDYQNILKRAAIRAGAEGNDAHLDAMLDNRLLSPQQFVQAYMESFFFEKLHGGSEEIKAQDRRGFLDWLAQRGIVDQTFVDEAKTVEVRLTDAKTGADSAATNGWKQSTRELPLSDGTVAKPDESQVEVTRLDAQLGAVMYVFNLNAERVHRIRGGVVQEIPLQQLPDPALLDEARHFHDSLRTEAPVLEWKKGEPFRLRFKTQP